MTTENYLSEKKKPLKVLFKKNQFVMSLKNGEAWQTLSAMLLYQ